MPCEPSNTGYDPEFPENDDADGFFFKSDVLRRRGCCSDLLEYLTHKQHNRTDWLEMRDVGYDSPELTKTDQYAQKTGLYAQYEQFLPAKDANTWGYNGDADEGEPVAALESREKILPPKALLKSVLRRAPTLLQLGIDLKRQLIKSCYSQRSIRDSFHQYVLNNNPFPFFA